MNAPEQQVQPIINIEAEQAVLGALLLNNHVLDRVSDILQPEHFYDPVHGRIFEVAAKLVARGDLVSPVTMKGIMAQDPGLQELGGPGYLARLAEATVSIISARDYAVIVRDRHTRRALQELGANVTEKAGDFDPDTSPIKIVEQAEEALFQVREQSREKPAMASFGAALTAAAEIASEAYKNDGAIRQPTGIDKLDKVTGGLRDGMHTVIAARTSMGKSALAQCIASRVARAPTEEAPGVGVCYVSLEMTAAEVGQRMASEAMARAGTRLPYADIDRGKMSEDQFRFYLETCRDIERKPILIDDSGNCSLPAIYSSIRRAQRFFEARGGRLGLAVVDYIQMVQAPEARSKVESVGAAAQGMKALALQLNVPVFSISQISRSVDAGEGSHRPTMADLRWSGELEEAANQIIMLYRPAYYLERGIKEETDDIKRSEMVHALEKTRHDCELIIPKNRGGPAPVTVDIWGDLAVNRFEDNAPGGLSRSEQGAFI